MIVSSSNAINISSLAPETYAMLDDLARRHEASRYRVAKAILENVRGDEAERIVTAEMGKPKRRHRIKYASRKEITRTHISSRRQDDICREIHGKIPMGMHCGYPNCRCGIRNPNGQGEE